MLPVIVSVVFPVGVLIYNYISLRKPLQEAVRNGFVMLGLCIMFSLPVGNWETRYVESAEPVESSMVYVTPCDHHTEVGGCPAYITPIYTSVFEMCFSEDEHVIQYCPDCYTRKEAINIYIAQR